MSSRGCGRVRSQTEIATVCPCRTRSRSGGPATGARSAREHDGALVGDRRLVLRLDHGRAVGRQLGRQPRLAVRQLDRPRLAHGGTVGPATVARVTSVLVLQHEDGCPVDRLGGWLAEEGVELVPCRPYAGDRGARAGGRRTGWSCSAATWARTTTPSTPGWPRRRRCWPRASPTGRPCSASASARSCWRRRAAGGSRSGAGGHRGGRGRRGVAARRRPGTALFAGLPPYPGPVDAPRRGGRAAAGRGVAGRDGGLPAPGVPGGGGGVGRAVPPGGVGADLHRLGRAPRGRLGALGDRRRRGGARRWCAAATRSRGRAASCRAASRGCSPAGSAQARRGPRRAARGRTSRA